MIGAAMTNGERLKYDGDELKRRFDEFVKAWPHRYEIDTDGVMTRYDSLSEAYRNYSYKMFVDWMNSPFNEFEYLDLLPGGIVVLDKDNDSFTTVSTLNIFDSGWAFHLELLRQNGYDISKPWTIVAKDHKSCRNCLKTVWSEEDKAELIRDIDEKLLELDRSKEWQVRDKTPYHGTVYYKPEDWPFYRTFAKVLRTLKLKIQNDDFKWDEGFLNEMMERTDR